LKNQPKPYFGNGFGPSRAKLISWLLSIQMCSDCSDDSLFTAVNIMDRYMQFTHSGPENYQLIAATCLLIATKIDDILCPSTRSLCKYSKDAFSRSEMVAMERSIGTVLDWQFITRSPKHVIGNLTLLLGDYLNDNLLFKEVRESILHVACCLSELTLMSSMLVGTNPMAVGAASVLMACRLYLGQSVNVPIFEWTGLENSDIVQVSEFLLEHGDLHDPEVAHDIRMKYSATCKLCVAFKMRRKKKL
jgi:hypothetical protein